MKKLSTRLCGQEGVETLNPLNPCLDRQGEPITREEWQVLQADDAYRRVAWSEVTSSSDEAIQYGVSTVWVGTNYQVDVEGLPIIFESMVFAEGEKDPGSWSNYCVRYSSESEAKQGHTEVVSLVVSTVPDSVVQGSQ